MFAPVRAKRLVDNFAHGHEASPATRAAPEALIDGARRARAKLAIRRGESGFNHRVGHDIARAYDHRAPET